MFVAAITSSVRLSTLLQRAHARVFCGPLLSASWKQESAWRALMHIVMDLRVAGAGKLDSAATKSSGVSVA